MAFNNVASTNADKRMVTRLRKALTQAQYPHNANQVYDNLDSDAQIPDQPQGTPASRRELLDQLQKENPDAKKKVQDAYTAFCRAHHKEGTAQPGLESVTLGRVWSFEGMVAVLQRDDAAREDAARDLRSLIQNLSVEAQQDELRDTPLCRFDTMWAFHDATGGSDPFKNVGRSRDTLVNRLVFTHISDSTRGLGVRLRR